MKTRVEGFLKPGLGVLHWLQLGIYVRHAAVLETNHWPCSKESDLAMYLNHDLSMLRIFETFSESAPQIVLMVTVMLQEGKPDLIKVLKTAGSLSAVAFCVTTYHRCMRSFLLEKDKQPIVSSAVYFLWNLLLLSSRIVALALFASVEPCFIFTHLVCSWLVLFFFAWHCQTEFMESAAGEWLYRATVGLIWYFDWFNVVKGKTRKRTILYHSYVLLDICLLCGVWYWRMSSDPPHFEISCLEAAIIGGVVVLVYIVGLVVRIIYYQFFHPKLYKTDLEEIGGTEMEKREADELDSGLRVLAYSPGGSENGLFRQMPREPSQSQSAHCNKRMKKLAENFYSRPAEGGAV